MSCQSLNEQNEGNNDDWRDDNEERLVEDMEEFENREKPNLEETETVNLGDHDEIKETSVSIHLAAPQREELITCCVNTLMCLLGPMRICRG